MQKYEYLVIFVANTDLTDDKEMDAHLDADRYTEKLNNYGEAGWELVSADWKDDGLKAVMKRPKA